MRFPAPLALAALFLLPSPLRAGEETTLQSLGQRQAEIETAVRETSSLQRIASRQQNLDRLRCLDDRMMYLKGLDLAGRAAVDEYALAEQNSDPVGMSDAITKMDRAQAAMPRYLEEARLCGTQHKVVSDARCTADEAREGITCTKWVVTTPRNARPFGFGPVPGGRQSAGRSRPAK
jgi:hypothetical protein